MPNPSALVAKMPAVRYFERYRNTGGVKSSAPCINDVSGGAGDTTDAAQGSPHARGVTRSRSSEYLPRRDQTGDRRGDSRRRYIADQCNIGEGTRPRLRRGHGRNCCYDLQFTSPVSGDLLRGVVRDMGNQMTDRLRCYPVTLPLATRTTSISSVPLQIRLRRDHEAKWIRRIQRIIARQRLTRRRRRDGPTGTGRCSGRRGRINPRAR